jgi:hypothetical protein
MLAINPPKIPTNWRTGSSSFCQKLPRIGTSDVHFHKLVRPQGGTGLERNSERFCTFIIPEVGRFYAKSIHSGSEPSHETQPAFQVFTTTRCERIEARRKPPDEKKEITEWTAETVSARIRVS